MPHKKRGRPRLRDGRGSRDEGTPQQPQHHQILYPAPMSPAGCYASASAGAAMPEQSSLGGWQPSPLRPQPVSASSYMAASFPNPPSHAASISDQPIAFLEIDQGLIINCNEDFKRRLGYSHSLQGVDIKACLAPSDWETVNRLLSGLSEARERQRLLAPETAANYNHLASATVESLSPRSLTNLADLGAHTMTLRQADGYTAEYKLYFRLVFSHVYFAAVWLIPAAKRTAGPLYARPAAPMHVVSSRPGWAAADPNAGVDPAAAVPRSLAPARASGYAAQPSLASASHALPDDQQAYGYRLSGGSSQHGAAFTRRF